MTHARTRHKSLALAFLCISVGFGVLAVVGLSTNGKGAVERYDRLIAADQAGGSVEDALRDLRVYVHSHMNAEIGGPNGIHPPIQLNGTYTRLIDAESQRVEAVNEPLYAQAQQYCESADPQSFSGGSRVACIDEYVGANGTSPQVIPPALYTFDFVSPRWSPDLAGLSLAAAAVSLIVTVFYWLRHTFR